MNKLYFVVAEVVEYQFNNNECGYVPTVTETRTFNSLEEAKKEMPHATNYQEFDYEEDEYHK